MAKSPSPNGRAKRSRSPRRRHQEILDVAAAVFREKGYESTSIQEIADRVGMLKGSLYYYITSKEDVLYEIIEGVHEKGLKSLDRVAAVDGDALQRLRAFVVIHFTFNAENLDQMAVFFHDFRSLNRKHRKLVVEKRDRYEGFLRDLIRQGQDEGCICPDIDPKSTALRLFGMLNWIYDWYQPGGERSALELGSDAADFVVAGLACSPATHSPGHRRALAPLPPSAIALDDTAHAKGTSDRKPRKAKR